ncbi:cell wall hydrolase [Halobacillus sp. Marseille-P3879]|uniref:cell wall hydrolase n=1 Tax=Halobacillus sp. Marseille-P3879 TaxID=2045014 RepID=UPI000C7C26CC|nr:cell wall hydrolase [Halobacillus sp. Marseille-P3879]
MSLKVKILFSILGCLLISSNFPKQSFAHESILKTGVSGQQVVEVQEDLALLGYLEVKPTGYYGKLTEEAIRQLQEDFNLPVDGAVGQQTLRQLGEIEKVAKAVNGEARGESYEGQVAVAAVIKNRLHSSEFPSTIEEVIHQENAFTPVHNGQYDLIPTSTAYQAVKDAWKGWDPTSGATYFYNPKTSTSEWIFTNTTPSVRIEDHLFAEYAD